MVTYAALHTHSYFSLLDGASSPSALVAQAAALALPALALTDHDNLIGAIELAHAAQTHGLKTIMGAELTLTGGHHVTALAADISGYRNLCRLISLAHREQPKGQAALPFDALAAYHHGLFLLSGCKRGELGTALRQRRWHEAQQVVRHYKEVFGREQFFIELQNHRLPHDLAYLRASTHLAAKFNLRCLATNNVHYATPDQHRLHDVLTCIRDRTTLDKASHLLRHNQEFYLKSSKEMQTLFRECPTALSNTLLIAEQGNVTLDYGVQSLPESVFIDRHGIVRAIWRGYIPSKMFLSDMALITS